MCQKWSGNLISPEGHFDYEKQRALPRIPLTKKARSADAKFACDLGAWQTDKMSVSIVTHEASNSVSIQDAKVRLDDLIARVGLGEEWSITDSNGQIVAVLASAKQNLKVSGKHVPWPDFMARLREQWPAGTPGKPLSEIVDEGRGPRP